MILFLKRRRVLLFWEADWKTQQLSSLEKMAEKYGGKHLNILFVDLPFGELKAVESS